MIYVMGKLMYSQFINGASHRSPMTHEELIVYVNQTFGLRGIVVEIQIN